jgi:FAD/FMN-containing dehydrogenase
VTLPVSRAALKLPLTDSLLVAGNGRSYGDVGLNTGHALLLTRGLDRYIGFDEHTGVLECEAGVLLADIIRDFLPRGWFMPVVPGTRYVSVGGAIANDVHGKNHHAAGSFGDQVESLELLRSDSTLTTCSRTQNADLFAATIAGLGLTGMIVSARLKLRRVETGWVQVTSRRFHTLAEFFELNTWAEAKFDYTVAWIDCLSARARADGSLSLRGVYLAGAHAPRSAISGSTLAFPPEPKAKTVPFTPPVSLINAVSLRAFNAAYWAKSSNATDTLQTVYQYFWPLDALLEWNRIYGKRGFFQYQCVLPHEASSAAIAEVLSHISRSGQGSFLAVLKTFGNRKAPGLLSFARPGVTLALDFPHLGERTLALFRELDAIVLAAGGALYPAKDATMSPELFRAGYPALNEFQQFVDPKFSSAFWRRLAAT